MYVTGRSTRAQPAAHDASLQRLSKLAVMPGNVDQTAEEVTREGGRGVAVRCDHTRDEEYLRGNLFHDRAKAAMNRLAFGIAVELRAHGAASLAVAPGWMRAVAALASDANVASKSGRVLLMADLAREYGFTDVDGRQVEAFHI